MHRVDFDPPESWASLWEMPVRPNSHGHLRSPPCMCGQSDCAHTLTSGACVYDPSICWSCHSHFDFTCLDGPAKLGMSPPTADDFAGKDALAVITSGTLTYCLTEAVDIQVSMTSWGQCPRCDATLGGCSMPGMFRGCLVGLNKSLYPATNDMHDIFTSSLGLECQTSLRGCS
jgi:hypothetical protein